MIFSTVEEVLVEDLLDCGEDHSMSCFDSAAAIESSSSIIFSGPRCCLERSIL